MAASILNVDEMFNNRIWHVYQGNFSTFIVILSFDIKLMYEIMNLFLRCRSVIPLETTVKCVIYYRSTNGLVTAIIDLDFCSRICRRGERAEEPYCLTAYGDGVKGISLQFCAHSILNHTIFTGGGWGKG